MTARTATYAQALADLLPPGDAFQYEPGSGLARLLEGFAAELERVDGRILDLLREGDPRATLELLTAWENALGLPSPCTGPLTTIQERRSAIVARLTLLGGQTPAFFRALAAALGYTIRVEEFRQFEAGRSRAGDPITNAGRPFVAGAGRAGDPITNGQAWLYTFAVVAPLVTSRTFQAGRSVAGEPLRAWQNLLLECTIRSVVPAHVAVVFRYELVQAPEVPTRIAARQIAPAVLEFLSLDWSDLLMFPSSEPVSLVNYSATAADEFMLPAGSVAPVELPTLFLSKDQFADGGLAFYEIAGGYVNQTGGPVSLLLELFRDEDVSPFYTFAMEAIPAAINPAGTGQFWISLRLMFRSTTTLHVLPSATFNPNTTAAGTAASGHELAVSFRDVGKNWAPFDLRSDRRIRPRLRKAFASSAWINTTEVAAGGLVTRSNGGNV